MEFIQTEKGILIRDVKNFDPFVSFECGQCFRFEKIDESEYTIIAKNRLFDILKTENGFLFKGMTEAEINEITYYFDLDRDYSAIIDSFSFDAELSNAAEVGGGIRILRQDPWETLISFIISANNNIPRIKKIISSLCVLLGEEKNGIYSFPTPKAIVEAGIEGIAPIKSGFRAKYIIDAAEKVLSDEINLDYIAKCGYSEALTELKKIKGVGDKVANCVLLFGFGYYEAFPIDVWVKKVIEKYYGSDFDPTRFGKYAGIAQQYLFYRERNIL